VKLGKLYFAMVDASDVFDPDVHNVEDLKVFDLKISQNEGEFARAQLQIPNPGIGLLSATRKQYLFISCDFNGNVEPIFSGRVIGFPTDFGAEIITVEYIAQSEDWFEDQQAFLETLKVSPYYNVLFSELDKRDDPVEILATRNALLHWSRLPGGTVSLSDIIQGSSTINIDDNYLFDSLKTIIGDPPLKRVEATVEVQWIQSGSGEVDAGTKIKEGFAPNPKINTLTPQAFEAAWKGVEIPTGYTLKQSVLNPIVKGISPSLLKSPATSVSSEFFPTKFGIGIINRTTHLPRVWYDGILKLIASYSQKRKEIMHFSLESTTQEFSLTRDSVENIDIKLQDPTEDAQGNILNPNKPSFFYDHITEILTSYGKDVVENALLRARARLMKAARVVEASFQVPISSLDILNISCDHSIHIEDDRLPGSKMRGKVISYSLHFSESEQIAEMTIGSLIGTGVDSSGAGTPLATETYDNEDTMAIDSDMESSVIYSLVSPPDVDQPIDVEELQTDPFYTIVDVTVFDSGQDQVDAFPDLDRPDEYLNEHGTAVTVDLKSMNPENELLLEFDITTQPLTLPQHVDLEAS